MKKITLLYMLGRPFSPFYSLMMRVREFLYRSGIVPVARVGVPVVSIGNLTMGGSGKTPVVQYVARMLRQNGWRPAVISRGYGGLARARVNVVSDGREVLLDALAAGDEPRLLAETLSDVPVLTGRKRVFPALRAVDLGANVLILDDGFQHLALSRDIDLVLFHADYKMGNYRVFPGGDLREPVRSLHRCHGFVLTGVDLVNRGQAEQFAGQLRRLFPDQPVFMAGYRPAAVLSLDKNGMAQLQPVSAVKNMKLFGFSGIARPENFRKTLVQAGLSLCGFRSFVDHYCYRAEDLDSLIAQAQQLGADGCVTTEKDLVKLSSFEDRSIPLYALRMEVIFDNDFNQFLLTRVGRQKS